MSKIITKFKPEKVCSYFRNITTKVYATNVLPIEEIYFWLAPGRSALPLYLTLVLNTKTILL